MDNQLSSRFQGRWKFFQYLTGLGFSIYNTYKNKFEVEVYQKLYAYLLSKDGFKAERNVPMTMYWGDDPIPETYKVPFLINGNIIMDIYATNIIDDNHRTALKCKMKLIHCPYGMIVNFDRTMLYTEKYIRDKKTGIIDRI